MNIHENKRLDFSMRVVPRINFERFAPEYESIPGRCFFYKGSMQLKQRIYSTEKEWEL